MTQSALMKIQRALLSVSDKTGLIPLARGLADLGIALLSTGGTAAALREAGIPVEDVAAVTEFPEILGGRVKTLHPKVHGGILQRRADPDDTTICAQLGIPRIDLVVINLYPFEQSPDIETIDIGGPAMLRAAAKNHGDVIALCDPADYPPLLEALQREGDIPLDHRRRLAQKVFARLAAYDTAIAAWLAGDPLPDIPLRYGENPHQSAFFRPDTPPPAVPTLATARILHGAQMSFNNYLDADAALEAARELHDTPAAVVVKHTNPCGAATGATLAEALEAAWEGDIVSAFGSVIAVTRPVDLAVAEVLKGRFVEALIAPAFTPEALEFLKAKSQRIRLISLDAGLGAPQPRRIMRQIHGGMLLQDADVLAPEDWRVVTQTPFPDDLRPLARFGIRVGKHIKSNAIVLAWEYASGRFALLGMGAGQPNRVDAMKKLCLAKAAENIERRGLDPTRAMARAVLVSDAFFPFPDNIEAAAARGVRHIVEPGGSVKDADCIAAADAAGIAMAFSGCRHFRH